jgi:AcrR family transcriptional regulator
MRADARRNREALLAAARDVFTERGLDAPLDDVAKRAGIGNATMYRHFPTRQDLIVAVYADEVAALCERAPALLTEHDPVEALFAWLGEFVEHVASKRELAQSVTERRSALFAEWHEAMRAAAAELLAAAGVAVTAVDVLTLATGIAAQGTDAEQHKRLLTLTRHGIEATHDVGGRSAASAG